ncbi:MAG TPA: polyphenol oxidase family protein [Bdellovibrionota bacterium]|jgi:hypothetical protein
MLPLTQTQSKLLASVPGLSHGFTDNTTAKQDDDQLIAEVSIAKQVHGDRIVWAESYERRQREADGVATFQAGLAVGASSADCTPILTSAVDTSTNKVYAAMAVHGGWRGTAQRIAAKSFREFAEACAKRYPERQGSTRFLAAIGPCISYASFEVGEDVIQAFPGCESRGIARFLRMENGKRKFLFDLPGENARQLRECAKELGVALEIDQLNLCTVKLDTRFPSYRRDGAKAGRILSFLRFDG